MCKTRIKWYISVKDGLNTIERESTDTPVTVPYENTFGEADALKTDNSTYDRCGLPHHLLVPKGSAEGFHSQLFVMISDYETDKVSMQANRLNISSLKSRTANSRARHATAINVVLHRVSPCPRTL